MGATRITATELARNLSDILNRVKYKGEKFSVERKGEVIAVIQPVEEPKQMTLREFLELYETLPKPDDRWVEDMEKIHRSQGILQPPTEWPS